MNFKWVTFKVKDLEKSLHFYKELLEIPVAAQFGTPGHQIVMLGDPKGALIELIYDPSMTDINPGDGVSIGLEPQDIDALVGKLRDNGFEVSGPMSPNPNLRFFFVSDPTGYTIQLVESGPGGAF